VSLRAVRLMPRSRSLIARSHELGQFLLSQLGLAAELPEQRPETKPRLATASHPLTTPPAATL
jgi:hypothetical protein